jgi:hypothetical protein
MPAYDWPSWASTTAVVLLGPGGRVRMEGVDPYAGSTREYVPAGAGFVGLSGYPPRRPVYVDDDGVVTLGLEREPRTARPDDVRISGGWLLDRAAMTLSRERLEGCLADSVRVDLQQRVWCLNPRKTTLSWTDDGGRTWERHPLSTSYFWFCDGGTVGSDLTVQGEVVAIGLWRADISLDRGGSWQDVDLPYRRVGAYTAEHTGDDANCTHVSPLADGRLVMSYARVEVAGDTSNTWFSPVEVPARMSFVGTPEGLMLAASRKAYGVRLVSYDGARTWRPIRLRVLAQHLLAR